MGTILDSPLGPPRDDSTASEVDSVEDVFWAYCGSKDGMGGRAFAKVCRDFHLIEGRFTAAEADILFSKVVPKGQRRISPEEFIEALELIAEKRGVDPGEVCDTVAASRGPVLRATAADIVRLHDDKTTYTGVHRKT